MFQSFVDAVSGSAWTYAIVFGVAALDAFFPVVPSEATVITAAVLAAQGDLRLELIIPAAAIGAVCGDNVSYWAGRILGERIAEKVFAGSRRRHLDRAHRMLEERGGYLIIVGRFVPGGRTAVTFAAGSLDWAWRRFIVFDLAAGLIWASYAVAPRLPRREDVREQHLEGPLARLRRRGSVHRADRGSAVVPQAALRQTPDAAPVGACLELPFVRIGVPKETAPGERRVALVPEVVAKLVEAGHEVILERGAGSAASFEDAAFEEAGATLADSAWDADAVVKVQKPSAEEIGRLRGGAVLIGFLQPLTDQEGIDRLAAQGVTGFAMESIPRITRAQSMDALSSQATVGGYKAVLIAADILPRFMPMLTTAAGTVQPAKVLVLGAGVAGLQAIATARRLGAVVHGFDVRPAVKEQVESLGAKFLDLGVRGEETAGGYATELTPEQQAQQQAELEKRLPDYDAVITTAAIPGRPAPKLIPASAVAAMRPGSVIVDLAAETGGNCELTEPGQEIVREAVTIVGRLNLPSEMPFHASQLYARNVQALLTLLAPEGDLVLDFEDEIIAGACVTGTGQDGKEATTP